MFLTGLSFSSATGYGGRRELTAAGHLGEGQLSRSVIICRSPLRAATRRSPNAACLRGQVCGNSARAEWPVLGSRELPAGGGRRVRGGAGCAAALVLLPPPVRGAAGVRAAPYRLAEKAALGRAFSWARACGC